MTAKEFQEHIASLINYYFSEVIIEWNVAGDSNDDFNRDLYSPRMDIAIGPFNINRDGDYDSHSYRLNEAKRAFIDEIVEIGFHSGSFSPNPNPRCFIGIEIEESGSRKHMLGDIANASILSEIGLVVVLNNTKFDQFKKIKKYIDFAIRNGKLNSIFRNVIIIKGEDLERILRKHIGNKEIIYFLKSFNGKWQLHNNDPDEKPSNPHLHDLKTGNKLNPYTGEIYNPRTKRIARTMREKDLNSLLDQYKEHSGTDIRQLMKPKKDKKEL